MIYLSNSEGLRHRKAASLGHKQNHIRRCQAFFYHDQAVLKSEPMTQVQLARVVSCLLLLFCRKVLSARRRHFPEITKTGSASINMSNQHFPMVR